VINIFDLAFIHINCNKKIKEKKKSTKFYGYNKIQHKSMLFSFNIINTFRTCSFMVHVSLRILCMLFF